MNTDWDLHAFVRGGSTANNTQIPNAATNYNYNSFQGTPSLPFNNNQNSFQNFHGHFVQPFQNDQNFYGHFVQPVQNNQNFHGNFNQPVQNNQNFHGHFNQPFQNNQNSFQGFSGLINADQTHSINDLQEIYQLYCLDSTPQTENTNVNVVSSTPAGQIVQPNAQVQPLQQMNMIMPRQENVPPAGQMFQPNAQVAQVQPLQQMNMTMPRQENVPLGNTNFPSPLSVPATIVQPANRQKKRKNQKNQTTKNFTEVTQEEIIADSWKWRKYGQKPIKGSPHPRNYYRCNTSKGCSARKHVERSLLNPDRFLVSYANEHTHPRPIQRSSLSGASRYINNPTNGSGSTSGQNNMNITTTTNNNDNSRNTISLPRGSRSSPGSRLSPDTPTQEGEITQQNNDVQMPMENVAALNDDEYENIMMVNDLMMNDDDIFTFNSDDGDWFASSAYESAPWTPDDYIAAATMVDDGEGGNRSV